MRVAILIPLAVTAVALVIPDDVTADQLRVQSKKHLELHDDFDSWDQFPSWDDARSASNEVLTKAAETSNNALDEALKHVTETVEDVTGTVRDYATRAGSFMDSWVDFALETDIADIAADKVRDEDMEAKVCSLFGHCHHGHGHHGHDHDHKPNKTIYQLITESKYTTKLAKIINEDVELVRVLNSTTSNYTVFVPTDHAFEKLPHHHEKHSKEVLKRTLLYHISPDFYPAGRILASHTVPTLLKEKTLGDFPQRIKLGLSWKGLTLNTYSRVVAVNIFATNGVIHGIDDVLFVPPEALDVIEFLPAQFSTLLLGLVKTGLYHDFRVTATAGQTFFAPTNFAFEKLPLPVTAFLFSEHGLKYLKAILKYHVVSNQTLYSDAYYNAKEGHVKERNIPGGLYHINLPTLLDGRPLSVDIARFGGLITIKVNAFTSIIFQDAVVKDGVLQIPSDVLIPPKTPGELYSEGGVLTVEEIKQRVGPLLDEKDSINKELEL